MRSWFRHEQQSIRMALATVLHHSYDRAHTEYGAPRSQNTATGPGESNATKYTAKIRKTPPPQAFFRMFDEEDTELGARPGSVTDPVPHGRVERHSVEHRIVQIFDAPVPQMGDQLVELLQKIVTASHGACTAYRRAQDLLGLQLRWWSSWWKCQLSLGVRWQSSPRSFTRGVRFVTL